jgi:hypothetical protein
MIVKVCPRSGKAVKIFGSYLRILDAVAYGDIGAKPPSVDALQHAFSGRRDPRRQPGHF